MIRSHRLQNPREHGFHYNIAWIIPTKRLPRFVVVPGTTNSLVMDVDGDPIWRVYNLYGVRVANIPRTDRCPWYPEKGLFAEPSPSDVRPAFGIVHEAPPDLVAKFSALAYQTVRTKPYTPRCEGKCINKPEGKTPFQVIYNMICQACQKVVAKVTRS